MKHSERRKKTYYEKIFPNLALVTALTLAVSLLDSLISAVHAQDMVNIVDSIIRMDSQDFFKVGVDKFEREIQNLNQGRLLSTDNLLKISEELRIQEDLLQFEKLNVLPQDAELSRLPIQSNPKRSH